MQKVVLINGRFELLNGSVQIEIFDIKNLKRDDDGRVNSVASIKLAEAVSDLDAGRLALFFLRDSKYIDQTEYFYFLETFLANQPGDQAAADKQSYDNEAGRVSSTRKE
ncbi:MAG TPA: hypothetical protein VL625_02880 [Patescibacteria group bacterium]|nr:hypothetical protein [Patescibacteria group bacterium]